MLPSSGSTVKQRHFSLSNRKALSTTVMWLTLKDGASFLRWSSLTCCHIFTSWITIWCPYSPSFNPSFILHHNFPWTSKTLTASRRACLTERSSRIACSRSSSAETHACHNGGQVQSRPGSRLSWECPCTSEPVPKMSRVARYWRFCLWDACQHFWVSI